MAELAVGLSKSVVAGAITKVESAIDQDARLRKRAQRDLVFITLEFEMMRSFLDDANQEMKNNLVRTWVKHIRELAYDVEDCVENVVHLDNKPIFWRRLLPSFMAPPLQLDLAVEEIEQLKGRVEDVNNCYRRYNLINADSAAAAAAGSSKPVAVRATALNMLNEARWNAVTRQQFLGDLTQLITMEDAAYDFEVISLWGSGDNHGTTSIIMKAYNDGEIYHRFTYRAWVKLRHPFDPQEFIRNLMAQFWEKSFGSETATLVGVQVLLHNNMDKATQSQAHLLQEFGKLVTEERYLVVLEDLSDMVEWHAIRALLPPGKNGSRIIVSAQQPEIATMCISHPYEILELKHYSAAHSVCAIFKKEERWGVPIQMSPLVGRDSQINELLEYLSKARVDDQPVISVWGLAGVGKTSVVRELYEKINYLFQIYIWVRFSHPFNLRNLCRSILRVTPGGRFYEDPGEDQIAACRRVLAGRRCLVVIDDLRSKEEWDLIQAASLFRDSRSTVIVTTPEASIAAYCTNNEGLRVNVKVLDAASAFNLFTREVHMRNRSSPFNNRDPDVEVLELILKCGGLPTVIIALAGLLAPQTEKFMDTVRSLNARFMHHMETNPEFAGLRGLFAWMHSIILNPPDFLKPCIFYLTIFPPNHIIRRRRLVRRWIAEGYSKEVLEMHAEENAEKFFTQLLETSIFQQVPQLADTTLSDTRMAFYQVNGFIREYIVSRPIEENLVFELSGRSSLTSKSIGRHLVILSSWKRERILFESIDFSRLRSLTVFGAWDSFFISESMKMLRVLDLEDASGINDGDLETIVKQLHRLKFLSLRGCREIFHIPSSLGDLRQLQTLDIRGSSIVTLPASITKLQKLQYIRAGATLHTGSSSPPASSSCFPEFSSCHHLVAGVVVPRGIGKLKGLHTLGIVNVTASGGKAALEELARHTQLRKLGVSGINRRNSKELFLQISGHVYLESLSVQLDRENHRRCLKKDTSSQGFLDGIPLDSDNLRSLKLYGLNEKLPKWSNGLSKLTKLNVQMATFMEDDAKFLGELTQLCILRLAVNQIGQDELQFLGKLPKLCILGLRVKQPSLPFFAESNGCQGKSFEKVKILEIACSSGILHVTFGSEIMKNLELLKVECSAEGTYHVTGLNDLSELKEVLLQGTNYEALKEDLENQLINHPKLPVVKLVRN